MSSFYHKIILEILLTILCVRCFAQSESCSNSPIQIGVGDTAIYICIDSLFKPNELDSTFVLSYYFINASISVMNIRYYSNLRFFDIKIDTIYDIIPCGWIYNNDSLTICEWKDSAENNNVKTLLKGQHLRMSLQSIIPINFIGHGESSVIVHNKKTNEKLELPRKEIKNRLMRIIQIQTNNSSKNDETWTDRYR